MNGYPRLLLWNYSEEEQTQFAQFLKEVNAPPAVVIRKNQGHLCVKDILHTENVAETEFVCDEKIVLFYNISSKGIAFLIDQSKARQLPRPIYAAVTEYSIEWTFSELAEHLIAERDAFAQARPQTPASE